MASWWRSRAVALGAALVALVAVVALASRGHAPAGNTGGTRNVDGDLVFEYATLLVLLFALAGVPVLIWTIWGARREETSLPKRGGWMLRLAGTMALVAVVIVAFMVYRAHRRGSDGDQAAQPGQIAGPKAKPDGKSATRPFRFDWVPVIVVFTIGLGGAALVAVLLTRSHEPRRPDAEVAALALLDALDESLDDLRSERDARRAVIAAYARMERACAVAGLPRRPAEAPLEYLSRVLSDLLHASASSVSRLTALFERAKFSRHEIGSELKDEAIDALIAVRDELRVFST